MKRFSFRLEQVRKWREDQAELEEIRLEQLYAGLRVTEQQLTDMATEADRAHRAVLAKSVVTADELSAMEAFDDYAKHEMRRLSEKKVEIETRIAAQRQRVIEAHRSFRLLDGLRDKALIAWTAARDKEQDELGAELYLGQLARGRKSE